MEKRVGTFYGVSVGPGDPEALRASHEATARAAGYFATILVKEE